MPFFVHGRRGLDWIRDATFALVYHGHFSIDDLQSLPYLDFIYFYEQLKKTKENEEKQIRRASKG